MNSLAHLLSRILQLIVCNIMWSSVNYSIGSNREMTFFLSEMETKLIMEAPEETALSSHSDDSSPTRQGTTSKCPEIQTTKKLAFSKEQYQSVLITFGITNFIFNMGISVVIPFYPPLANEAVGLNFSTIGWVISCSPLGSIFGGILIAPKLDTLGRKNLLIGSLLVQAFAVFMFGVLKYMTGYPNLFLAISIISRLVQGLSRSIYGTIIFSYIPILWPFTIQSKVGLLESLTALGLMFGPILGAGLNSLLGYSMPFYGISMFFLLALWPTIKNVPPDSSLSLRAGNDHLSLRPALSQMKVVSTFFLMMAVIACLTYISPIFVHHMESFGFTDNVAAIIYSVPTLAYCISLSVVPKLQNRYEKPKVMSFGLMLCLAAALLLAPFWTKEPDSIAEIVVGQVIAGFAQAFSVIPSIPRLMDILQSSYDHKAAISDVASALFVTALSLGSFVSPILSGKLYDIFGGDSEDVQQEKKAFHETMLVLALIMAATLIQYIIMGGGLDVKMPEAASTKKAQQELLLEKVKITRE